MADERKKTYYFKGKNYDELKNLSQDEVMKIIGSRGKRNLKRGLNAQKQILMKKVEKSNELLSQGKQQLKIKTHSRDMIIVPKMIDLKIEVYNGKNYENVFVKPEMVGHYLGEFVLTRKRVIHGGSKAPVKGGKK